MNVVINNFCDKCKVISLKFIKISLKKKKPDFCLCFIEIGLSHNYELVDFILFLICASVSLFDVAGGSACKSGTPATSLHSNVKLLTVQAMFEFVHIVMHTYCILSYLQRRCGETAGERRSWSRQRKFLFQNTIWMQFLRIVKLSESFRRSSLLHLGMSEGKENVCSHSENEYLVGLNYSV